MPAHYNDPPKTEDEFNNWIYQNFRTACRQKHIQPSRELFMELVDCEPNFNRMVEKLKKDLGIFKTNSRIVQDIVDRFGNVNTW